MVYIIGAGPGDPGLITVKGKSLLEKADVVIYAGSLVNAALLEGVKPGCEIHDSAGMHLEELLSVMERGVREGKLVARLHTGDPSIYGAVREQMDGLAERGIPFEIVPGVSSFCAAAAALKREYTLPGVSQTVILTRLEGRTEVPEGESIRALAAHNAAMAVFLSVHMLEQLVERLRSGYGDDTPVAVVYKASWPEQKIIEGTLGSICKRVEGEGVEKTALVLVGRFLDGPYRLSRLYDKSFSHGFRGGGA